mgnify:CR=1 FL=1
MCKLQWFIIAQDEKGYEARAEIIAPKNSEEFSELAKVAYPRLMWMFEEEKGA